MDNVNKTIEDNGHNFILEGLNKEQLEAVTTTEGYIRVIAGAGSGKTKALTHRYAYLVEEIGIMQKNILCVTFTNKAAYEMKQRIRKMIGDSDLSYITTFHGFCVQLLKEDCSVLGFPKNFIILNEEDVKDILKDVFEQLCISTQDFTIQKAIDTISDYKASNPYVPLLISPDSLELNDKRKTAESIKDKIIYEFLYAQRKNFGLDFDDLINFVFYILSNYENVREKWQQRIQYIMVDEFQDVSQRQYALAKILSDYHKNLFIVGDPDQTIYTWRGASIDTILNFDKLFPSTKTIIMNVNYRSLPEILNVSNALIKNNHERIKKDLIPNRIGIGQSIYFHAKTDVEEAEWISKQIIALYNQGIQFSEITILYRAHSLSRIIEEKLIEKRIPYVLLSGIAFYLRKEIKDIISYLRMVLNSDDISFKRTINEPRRGIGRKRISFLQKYADEENCSLYEALKENISDSLFLQTGAKEYLSLIESLKSDYTNFRITDLLDKILNDTGYEEILRKSGDEERRYNIAELKQSIFDFENKAGENVSLEDYLSHIALYTNLEKQEKADSISLMTIHTAKGLEFPYVFVCGLNEGIFPSSRIHTRKELEEERRLAFVAFTRAKDKLFLSDAEGRNYDGTYRYPSRFIFNCEKVNLEYIVELPQKLIDEAKQDIKQREKQLDLKKLKKGDTVYHKTFGFGEIISDEEKDAYLIKFDTLDTPRRIAVFAPLEYVQ